MAVPSAIQSLRILIVDDEATIRTTLSLCLTMAEHQVAEAASGQDGLALAAAQVFDLIFLDLRLGTENGLDYIPRFLAQSPWVKVVVITAYSSIDTAVAAMKQGATDYLPKPFTPEQVELLATRVGEVRALESRVRELQRALGDEAQRIQFSSKCRAMHGAYELAERLAASKAAILLQGESGTGKRSLARAIHEWSSRRNGPFRNFAVAGRDEGDVDAELFGRVPGTGQVAEAEGGTLYLYDVAQLPQRLQLKLLQLIQTGTYEQSGESVPMAVDVRVVAGTEGTFSEAMQTGAVREDLYFSLSGKTVMLLPLRERLEDFGALAEARLAAEAGKAGKLLSGFTAEAMNYLKRYAWPGNLRELRNVIERGAILARPPTIGLHDLPPNMLASDNATAALGDLVSLESIEEQHIRGVLEKTKSLETAARILEIDYATLWRRRKRYGLQ